MCITNHVTMSSLRKAMKKLDLENEVDPDRDLVDLLKIIIENQEKITSKEWKAAVSAAWKLTHPTSVQRRAYDTFKSTKMKELMESHPQMTFRDVMKHVSEAWKREKENEMCNIPEMSETETETETMCTENISERKRPYDGPDDDEVRSVRMLRMMYAPRNAA
jgi:Coiled-coil domain-containing protein 124 /Oxs1